MDKIKTKIIKKLYGPTVVAWQRLCARLRQKQVNPAAVAAFSLWGVSAVCSAAALALLLRMPSAQGVKGVAAPLPGDARAAQVSAEEEAPVTEGTSAEGASAAEGMSAEDAAGAASALPVPTPAVQPAAGYQLEYPALYETPLPAATPADNMVYLTFDDGPSGNTAGILETLAQHGARAMWFVTGRSVAARPGLLEEILAGGHTLGLHSDTHEYKEIYASPGAFLADMDALAARVRAEGGGESGLVRLPGGSINGYDADCWQPLCAELLRRGYRYYDWNVSAQDAVSPAHSAAETAHRVIEGVRGHSGYAVVLLHDTKATTAAALPEILETLTAEGYCFAPLDSSVPMVFFGCGEMP